jgi:hypothetical protein
MKTVSRSRLGLLTAAVTVALVIPVATSLLARAQSATPTPPAAPPPPPTNCKVVPGAKCCDPAVAAHLAKEAIFKACGESDATYLGEKGSKDTCRYVFKGADPAAKEEAFVELYAPASKVVPEEPSDPFFAWKRLGRVYATDKAKSPKSAPMLASGTGLWMAGNGFYLQVNASIKVCSKAEAFKLAKSMK